MSRQSTAKTETLVYTLLEETLNKEDEASDISIERAHRLGKRRGENKPHPIIAKFSFHKDKDRTIYMYLIKVMKEATEEGRTRSN